MWDSINRAYQQYIKSPQGEMFPQAAWKSPEATQSFGRDLTQTAMGALMTPIAKIAPNPALMRKLMQLDPEDREILGNFVRLTEQNSRQNMGQVGRDASNVANAFNIDPTMSNKRLASVFNKFIQLLDKVAR